MAREKLQLKKSQQTISELPHKPHYEIRIASQSYSNIAAVLAGFAFAAVILVVQTDIPSASLNAGDLRDRATIAFLLAFVGCVISAFVFATISGEEILAPRSHTMGLIGGTGFSISANLVIFGLATLVKIFLSYQVYDFVDKVFPFMMLLSPMFVIFSAFDSIIGFEKEDLSNKDIAEVVLPGFLPLIIALIIKSLDSFPYVPQSMPFFTTVMWIAFIATVISIAGALIASSFADLKFRLSLPVSGILVCIHSVIISLFILIL